MQERLLFSEQESEISTSELPPKERVEVSVLRHIPAALKILDGRNRPCEIYSPRCLYQQELIRTGKHIMPKAEEGVRVADNRLLSIEDALFEYARIRERVKERGKVEKEPLQTLWEIYGEKELYYYRFEPKMRKNNFANVFMNIGGVNLEAKAKLNNLPAIKSKVSSQAKNNGGLIFDSNFESGNLLYVYKSDEGSLESYDLILQNDINTRGHNQWFYFKVTNTKKNQKVRLNIVNLVKKQSLFSYGLKPLTFSEKSSTNRVQWVRNGQKVVYEENNIKRQHKAECYYTLSFEYEFREAFDTVYFAPSHPYTYSQLYHFMNGLLQERSVCNLVSIKKVCESIGKNAINVITISTGRLPAKQPKTIWIIGRQHPVETTSSFMVEGIINYLLRLLGTALQMDDTFYDGYTFKIVPMLNPDGVIHGNTRAELTGIDSNRVWKKPSKTVTPTVYFIKKLIQRSKEQTCLVLDLHSHSKKLGCFFYGNYSQSDTKSFRFLPSSVCEKDPRFSYRSCRFRGGNDNSARKSLFRQLNITNIFTVECSLLGYLKENRITEFKISDYHEMGATIIETFLQLERAANGSEKQARAYPHEEQDYCDAQSARSDSCVSEDEYEQVYQLAFKKKDQGKSNKHRAITFNDGKQVRVPQAKKGPSSISKVLEVKPENEQERFATANQKQAKPIKPDLQREFSIKIRSNKNTKCVRTFLNRKQGNMISREEVKQQECKTYGEKSTQVQEMRSAQEPEMVRIKTEKRLMIVGNSVEDDKIYVGKNEVGVQIYSTTKENAAYQDLLPKKTLSNRLNCKISRRFTDTNESVKVEKPLKPEKKGVLMFRS